MQQREMILRCMAKKQDGLWVAMCIDLSLAAQAETQEEARQKLNEQIEDYILEAVSEPQFTEELLSRKAPLSLRLEYRWARSLIWLHGVRKALAAKQGEDDRCATFDCSMPMEHCNPAT